MLATRGFAITLDLYTHVTRRCSTRPPRSSTRSWEAGRDRSLDRSCTERNGMSGTALVQVPARMNGLGRIGTAICALENR